MLTPPQKLLFRHPFTRNLTHAADRPVHSYSHLCGSPFYVNKTSALDCFSSLQVASQVPPVYRRYPASPIRPQYLNNSTRRIFSVDNMHIGLFFSALVATTLATPVTRRQSSKTGASDKWTAAANTETTCDTACDKFISFAQGSQLETAVNNACAAMMPACAYQDRLPEGTFCTATIDYALGGPKNSTQQASVVDSSGKSIGNWDVQCKSSCQSEV